MILIRHADVTPTPGVAASRWPLSEAGRHAARTLAEEPVWAGIGRIFSSPEAKAAETAAIIAARWELTVATVEPLHEVTRPAGQWFGDEYPGGYPAAVAAYFAEPLTASHGWEPPAVAGARIAACIKTLAALDRAPFAVVGHGMALSLFVAAITGEDAATIWPCISLPDMAELDLERRVMLRPFGRWSAGAASP